MVRKSSSKILAKQTPEVVAAKPEPSQPPGDRQDASPTLDVSKDNLKEFCSKSRSLSPADVAVVAAPTLAQLRIQKDSKSSSASQGRKNDDGQGSSTTLLLCAKKTDGVPPQATSVVQKQVTPETVKQPQSPVLQLQATSGVQQHTTSGQMQQQQQQQQRDEPETRKTSSPVTSRSAAIDVPPKLPPRQEVAGDQRAWLDTNHNSCSLLRRSSDVSYMFSSFRTTTTTMSTSGFLGAPELQGLSERLQNLQSMFDDRDRAAAEVGGGGGSLHKLLLNRQHLTAAVADRKPKFKMSQLNRDVPFGSPPPASNLLYYMTSSSSCRSAPHSKRTSPEHETVSAKEMLLKLFYGGGGSGGDKAPESKVST